jgi:PAP2 superfamily
MHPRILGNYAFSVDRPLARRDALVQLAIVLLAVGAYEAARLALHPDWPVALENARRIAGWERDTGLAWEAPVQDALLGRLPGVVVLLNAFYLGAHFLVTGLFFVWLYRRSPPGFRVFRNAFLAATGLALIVAWRFPTAPPRVAGLGVVDTLRHFSDIDIGSPGTSGLTDPVAAVPSLHAGWAIGVAVGVAVYSGSRKARALVLLYPAAVIFTILATGNHFVLDALAGALAMALGFGLALLPRTLLVVPFRQRRGVEQPGSSPGS